MRESDAERLVDLLDINGRFYIDTENIYITVIILKI